ncbi:MAG: XdhC family protein, partial [Acidimicrobiia bacterium]
MVSGPLEAAARLLADERFGALATVVAGPGIGARGVVDQDEGVMSGSLPTSLVDDVVADALVLMEREQHLTITYGDAEVFIEVLAPRPHLVIFGAVHIAQELTTMARLVGFHAAVSDARPAFITSARFPDADELLVGWPDQITDRLTLDRRTYEVILSHDA